MKHLHFLRGNRKLQHPLMWVPFLSLFMLSAVFFTACDKQNPVAVDEQPNSEQPQELGNFPTVTFNVETARFTFNGKLVSKEEFKGVLQNNPSLMIVAGTGLPDTNMVYAFDSETGLANWAKTTQTAEKFEQMSQPASENSAAKVQSGGGRVYLYNGDLAGLGPYWNLNIFNLIAIPRLGDYNFDAKTSSAKVYGGQYGALCALYDLTSYGGGRLYLFSKPGVTTAFRTITFDFLQFNDKASSLVLL